MVQNIVLIIPDLSSSEKWDTFVSGLKSKLQFEVRKANCEEFEEATKIAMRVEAAFVGISSQGDSNEANNADVLSVSGLTPMEIDNTNIVNLSRLKQPLHHIRNNTCFEFH